MLNYLIYLDVTMCMIIVMEGYLNCRKNRNLSRSEYTKMRLKDLNGIKLKELLEYVVNNASNPKEYAASMNMIISREGYTLEYVNNVYIILGSIIENTEVENDIQFIDIQNRILTELEKARVSIWVAVSWFTNNKLFMKLLEKKENGVEVKLVIYDDETNRKHGVKTSLLDSVKIQAQRGGIMHDKFCIIDNQIVIHGSYNWTNKAEFKNEENISVTKDCNASTEFSIKFKELYNQGKG